MNIVKSIALVASSFVALAGVATSAHAGSPLTEMFIANVTPNVDFLDRSSRMALANSKSAKLKDFAKGQATEQTLAANTLYDLSQKQDAAPLQTGRSAAVAGQDARIVDSRLPMGQEDLDNIEGLAGIEFDEAFRAKQRTALLQLQQDYEDYIAKGDDAALKALATSELPKVKKAVASLAKA